jgi:hypothetical protein
MGATATVLRRRLACACDRLRPAGRVRQAQMVNGRFTAWCGAQVRRERLARFAAQRRRVARARFERAMEDKRALRAALVELQPRQGQPARTPSPAPPLTWADAREAFHARYVADLRAQERALAATAQRREKRRAVAG